LLAGIGNFRVHASSGKDGNSSALALALKTLKTFRVAAGIDGGDGWDIAITNTCGCSYTPSRTAHTVGREWNYAPGKILRVCHCGADMDGVLTTRDNNQ
jgi:hypothetical protein